MEHSEKPKFGSGKKNESARFTKPEDQIPLNTKSPNLKTASILIVDDNVAVRTITSRIVQRAGYDDITAMDNRENALKLIEQLTSQGKAILCISDFDMPKNMDYHTFREEALKLNPKLRILLMSGTMTEAKENGAIADVYMVKPFDVDNMIETIKRMVNETP